METSSFLRGSAVVAATSMLSVLLFTGCGSAKPSSPLPTTVANPLCEQVLAKAAKVPTDRFGGPGEVVAAQVMRWPSPEVTLGCGVAEPGPSTAGCLSANGVDWLEVSPPEAPVVSFVTYVRAPSVQVSFPRSPSNAINVLGEMSDLVRELPQLRSCT